MLLVISFVMLLHEFVERELQSLDIIKKKGALSSPPLQLGPRSPLMANFELRYFGVDLSPMHAIAVGGVW